MAERNTAEELDDVYEIKYVIAASIKLDNLAIFSFTENEIE